MVELVLQVENEISMSPKEYRIVRHRRLLNTSYLHHRDLELQELHESGLHLMMEQSLKEEHLFQSSLDHSISKNHDQEVDLE